MATKLRVMSDLHLEFGPLDLDPIGEDILVLAGDIGIYDDGAAWAIEYAQRASVPAVMIAGNHEFYRNSRHDKHTVASTLDALRKVAAKEPLLTFLEDDIATVAGVTFVGCTLWTDFALNGDPLLAAFRARESMNDYYKIYVTDGERLTPEGTAAAHAFSRGVLEERLPRRHADRPLVVMTHHLPSARSIAGRYAGSDYNAAYASDLDSLVAQSEAELWVHGHTHISQDYRIGYTRVLCNPRGYDGVELNPQFDPTLIVEI